MTWVLHDGAKMCLEHQEQDLPKRFTEACEKDQTGRVSGHCVTKQLPVFLLTHSRRGGGGDTCACEAGAYDPYACFFTLVFNLYMKINIQTFNVLLLKHIKDKQKKTNF